MNRFRSGSPSSLLVLSVVLVVAGVASNDGFASSFRTIVALALTAVGLAGVATVTGERSVDALRHTAKRWWLIAFAAFLPYGLATAPSNESAAAVGDAFSGPVVVAALEAVAGATVLSAVVVTVLFGLASYGVHPGRPTPEERVLNDGGRDR